MRRLAVDGEDVSCHIVAGAHSLQDCGVALGNCSELRVAVRRGSRDGGDRDIVDHPPFIPAALVVDDEQRVNVGEDIVESARVVGSVGSPGLGSNTTRTAPTVGRPQFAPVTVNCTWSFTPGIMVVKTLGSKPVVSRR